MSNKRFHGQLIVTKKCPLAAVLRSTTRRMKEAGVERLLMARWTAETTGKSGRKKRATDEKTVVNFGQVAAAFLLVASAIAMAPAILGVELMGRRITKAKRLDRRSSCANSIDIECSN